MGILKCPGKLKMVINLYALKFKEYYLFNPLKQDEQVDLQWILIEINGVHVST